MKRLFSFTFLIAVLLFVANCQNSAGQNESLLAPEIFAVKLKKTTNAQVLDVRSPQEFADKHLAQALNVDFNGADFQGESVKQLDKTKPVFVYCLAGGRSASASKFLRSKGYEVYEMQGGLAKWQSAKLPLDLQPNAPDKKGMTVADFQANLAQGKLTLVDFSATWCQPCKKLKPILEQVGKDMSKDITLQIHDFDANPELASHFKIDALPTIMLFKGGKVVWQFIGVMEEEALKNEIKKQL